MKRWNLLLLLAVCSFNAFCQDTLTGSNIKIYKALAFYPLQKQLGYRSNLTKKWFSDFKGGMTFSALPFFVLEYNRNCRFVNANKVKVYSGIGITLDSYVPGLQVPFGIELVPIATVAQLSFIAEVKPKVSFGPSNFLNTSFSPHVGLAYYFKQKSNSK
jgi:hypothetical protein